MLPLVNRSTNVPFFFTTFNTYSLIDTADMLPSYFSLAKQYGSYSSYLYAIHPHRNHRTTSPSFALDCLYINVVINLRPSDESLLPRQNVVVRDFPVEKSEFRSPLRKGFIVSVELCVRICIHTRSEMTMKTLVLLVFTIVLSLLIVTSEGLSFSEEDEETDEKILASLKDISSEDTEPSLRVQLIPVPPEGDEVGRKSDQQGSTEAEFGRDDLVDLVEELEQDALEAEREQLIPQILGFLHGSSNASSEPELRTASSSTEPSEKPTTTSSSARKQILHRGSEATNSKNSNIAELSSFEPDLGHFENSTFVDEGDLLDEDEDEDIMEAPLPRDLSDLTEDIADDITAGVEESLRLFSKS